MAAGKEIRIQAMLDTTNFDKEMERLRRKMQDMKKAEGTAGMEGLSPQAKYAAQTFARTSQTMLRQDQMELEKQRREEFQAMLRKQRELKTIEKAEGDITREKEKQIRLLREEINLSSQRIMKMDRLKQEIGERLGIPGAGGGAGQPPGQPPVPPTPEREPMSQAAIRRIVQAIGINTIVQGALNTATYMVERERNMLQNQAGAAQIAARPLLAGIQGRGAESLFFGAERLKAAQMAVQEQQGQRGLDFAKIGAGIAGGAAAGTLIPGVGNVVGAIAGGVGAFAGTMAFSDRLRARLFDQNMYTQMLTREGMQKFEANLLAQQQLNPMKGIAFEGMAGNYQDFIGLQRGLGLGDVGLFGEFDKEGNRLSEGMLRTQMMRGGGSPFTRQNIEQNISQMISGGASTEMARGMGGRAAMFQRNMLQQNAPQILAQLSAAGMGAQQSEEAFKKILSEAVKIGVDTSKMPQEMQRMSAVAVQLATQGGGFSQSMVQDFMRNLTGTSQVQIQAAGTVSQEMEKRSKASEGLTGMLGYAFLQGPRGEKAFGKEGAQKIKGDWKLMKLLNKVSAKDLEQDPALRKFLASDIGISEEALMKAVPEMGLFKQTELSEQERAAQALSDVVGFRTGAALEEALVTEKGSEAYGNLIKELMATDTLDPMGRGAAERRALTIGLGRATGGQFRGGGVEDQLAAMSVEKQLETQRITAPEAFAGQVATGQMTEITAISQNAKELLESAKMYSEARDVDRRIFEKFREHAEKSADALEIFRDQLVQVVESMQEKGIVTAQPSGKK